MTIDTVRLTKEDPIPENLVLPANEVLLRPASRALFKLRAHINAPLVYWRGTTAERGRTILLTLSMDRGWSENWRRLRVYLKDDLLVRMCSGSFYYKVGIRRADCCCTPGLGHRRNCPNRPRSWPSGGNC